MLTTPDHIVLILMYRRASLSEAINTYPAKNKPAVPSKFRSTLSAREQTLLPRSLYDRKVLIAGHQLRFGWVT
jgi:hypothetical protein